MTCGWYGKSQRAAAQRPVAHVALERLALADAGGQLHEHHGRDRPEGRRPAQPHLERLVLPRDLLQVLVDDVDAAGVERRRRQQGDVRSGWRRPAGRRTTTASTAAASRTAPGWRWPRRSSPAGPTATRSVVGGPLVAHRRSVLPGQEPDPVVDPGQRRRRDGRGPGRRPRPGARRATPGRRAARGCAPGTASDTPTTTSARSPFRSP